MFRSLAARAAFSLLVSSTAMTLLAPVAAAASPAFQLPFTCGEVWMGSTYKGHGHEDNAVDFSFLGGPNAGREVRSSAPGTVVDTSAWKANGEVVIQHAGGWTTVYVHLDNDRPAPKGTVAAGAVLGRIDPTPNPHFVQPDGFAHLHYEQRLNGVQRDVVINGAALRNGVAWRSTNCPPPPPPVLAGPALVMAGDGSTVTVSRWGGQAANGSTVKALKGSGTAAVDARAIGDRVVAGDFDADGTDDLLAVADTGAGATFVVWDAATGPATTRFSADVLGLAGVGSRVVAGDWNADGRDDVALAVDLGHHRMVIRRYLSTPVQGGFTFTAQDVEARGAFDIARVANRMVAGSFDAAPGDDVAMAYQAADGRASIFVFSGANAAASVGRDGAHGAWHVTAEPYDLATVAGRMVAGSFSGSPHDDIAFGRARTDGSLVIDRFDTAAAGGVAAVTVSGPLSVSAAAIGNRLAAGEVTGDKVDDVIAVVQAADGTMDAVAWKGAAGAPVTIWDAPGGVPLTERAQGRMVVGDWA